MKVDPTKQPELPGLTYHVPVVQVRQADGSLLIRAGKPVVVEGEIGTGQFAREVSLSQAYVQELCEQGLIACRRSSPKDRSRYLIPRSEVERFRKLA